MELKASELRIGNWIQDKDGILKVLSINDISGTELWCKTLDGKGFRTVYMNAEPVELTEERLEKWDFKKMPPLFENISLPYWVKDSVCLFFNESPPENTYLTGYGFTHKGVYYAATQEWIKYAHEIQNFYFTNRNTELTMK